MNKSLKYIAIISLLSGCAAFDDDWPNLADPMPKPPERSQVEGRPGGDVVVIAPRDTKSLTAEETRNAFGALKSSLAKEWIAYGAATAKLKEETDDETALMNWSGAQLALSRVSSNIGTIQDLTLSNFNISVGDDALLLEDIKHYVRGEEARLNIARKQLMSVKP